jgi:hypothetical protein
MNNLEKIKIHRYNKDKNIYFLALYIIQNNFKIISL